MRNKVISQSWGVFRCHCERPKGAKQSLSEIASSSRFAGLLAMTRYYFIFGFLLAGCAAVGPVRKAEILPIPNLYLNNSLYYPLKDFCAHYGVEWDYDSIARQVTLSKPSAEVKLLIESSVVLVNGSPLDIGQQVLLRNGTVCLPLSFKEKVADRLYREGLPKPPVSPATRRIKRIVIDAGHGGHDPGAIGKSGLREKDVNLDIARRLANLLESKGITAILTRSSDKFIPLSVRADIANKANADLFVSLHSNSARSRKLNGFEVYYITDKIDDSSRALKSAQDGELNIESASFYGNSLNIKAALWDMLYTESRGRSISLAQSICQSAQRNMGLRILGVKGARFAVLKGSNIPAVLVEMGFLSNPTEERYLRNGFYRQQLAEAVCGGILDYEGRYNNLAEAGY